MDNGFSYEEYVGKVLDRRYRLEKLLGIGGMAVVYKATDMVEDHPVAIKLLKKEISDDEEALKRFKNESQAVSMLSHPNIVGIYSVSTENELKYLVMEYLEGITLRTYMDKKGALPYEEVVAFSEQILAALNHAHSRGIIHRDIKPQNILLLKDGIVKVTDFGIAEIGGPEVRDAEDIKAVGTVYYISPEQADQGYSDARSDLYSLGVMMYEMATSVLPFDGENTISVMMRQISEKPVPPRKINRKIPRGLQNIILYAMEKNPKNRYASALDMFRELRKLRTGSRARVLSPAAVVKERRSERNRAQNRPSRSVTPVILGVAFAVLFLAIVSLFVGLDRLNIGGIGRKSISVPAVAGNRYRSLEELNGDADLYREELEKLGLDNRFSVTVEYEYSDFIDEGLVIRQSPAPGANRKAPVSVKLTVSRGVEKVTVEDFTVMDWRTAQAGLREKGFAVTIVKEKNISIPAGSVIGTDPGPGTVLRKGSIVTLRVSIGTDANLVPMEDYRGKSEAEVTALMETLGMTVGKVTYTRSSLPAGCVVSHDPEPGENIYTGATTVDFVVSGGKDFNTNVYPEVAGMSRDEAVELLTLYGMDVSVIKVSSDSPVNTVIKQDPNPAGTITNRKALSSVTLRVSGGPDYTNIVNVMNVVGETAEDAKLLLNYNFGEDASLVYMIFYRRSASPVGQVLNQSPAAMSQVDAAAGNVYVYLTVSGGPDLTETLLAPDVIGCSLDEAEALAIEEGFVPKPVWKASDTPYGLVFEQKDEAGSEVTGLQGLVELEYYVSGGPGYVETEPAVGTEPGPGEGTAPEETGTGSVTEPAPGTE
jgi:serine/threonine-protein kinase